MPILSKTRTLPKGGVVWLRCLINRNGENRMNIEVKIKALLIAVFIQICFAGIFFIGGLMDPLISIWLAATYFFVVGSYLLYRNILNRLISKYSFP